MTNEKSGVCPECASTDASSISHVSRDYVENDPWSRVLKVVNCGNCGRAIPAHLFELWDDLTPKAAKLEWERIYRNRPSGLGNEPRISKGQCPECGATKIEAEADIKREPIDSDPWSKVLEIIQCGGCHGHIPKSLWFTGSVDESAIKQQIWKKQYRDMPSGCNGRNFLERTGCPECESSKFLIEWHVEQEEVEGDPWSKIKDVTLCAECHGIIPSLLWDLWDGLTPTKAKEIWKDVYKNKSSGLEEQRDEFLLDLEAQGNPLKILKRECVKLLRLGEMRKLISKCNKGIKESGSDPITLEFIKLRAIGYAETKRFLEAKRDFLKILEILPNDGPTLSNYLAACFDSGDKDSALDGIRLFYPSLDQEMKALVLENLVEALRVEQVKPEDLPEDMIDEVTALLNDRKNKGA